MKPKQKTFYIPHWSEGMQKAQLARDKKKDKALADLLREKAEWGMNGQKLYAENLELKAKISKLCDDKSNLMADVQQLNAEIKRLKSVETYRDISK